jgi:hypothetical protein
MRAAFFTNDGGSDAPSATPAPPGAALGPDETIWPLWFLMVTTLVTLLMTTVLWMLLKITLCGGATT